MRLEKPLYTLLLASLALTLLTLLQPPGNEALPFGDSDLLSSRTAPPAAAMTEIHAWRRQSRPLRDVAPAIPSNAVPPVAQAALPPPVIPAPPVMAETPPPRPAAPEPGFRYLGRLNRDAQTWIFIAQGENSYAVLLGQTFEGRWRFDAVQPDRLDLTYLPLHMTRSLTLRDE